MVATKKHRNDASLHKARQVRKALTKLVVVDEPFGTVHASAVLSAMAVEPLPCGGEVAGAPSSHHGYVETSLHDRCLAWNGCLLVSVSNDASI